MKRPRHVKRAVVGAMLKNLAMGIPIIRKRRVEAGRTAATAPQMEGLATYSYNLYDAVVENLGPVRGRSVLEFGPGDNILAGLVFLAAGASRYTALDRFPGPYGSPVARQWYRLLAADWPYRHPDLPWPADLDVDKFPDDPRVEVIPRGVEAVGNLSRFDIVCSYAVAEHVSDIEAFAEATRVAIGETGAAVHVIDFGGHEWNAHGDPFLFLKFPKWLWRLMGSNRGLPNRVRFDEYVACLRRHRLNVDVVDRRIAEFDPADQWVRKRATNDFLTHWAVLRLTPA